MYVSCGHYFVFTDKKNRQKERILFSYLDTSTLFRFYIYTSKKHKSFLYDIDISLKKLYVYISFLSTYFILTLYIK